jgi:hypothetical protein
MGAGEVVLKAGHFVGAAEVGILATVGATTVQVRGDTGVASEMQAPCLWEYVGACWLAAPGAGEWAGMSRAASWREDKMLICCMPKQAETLPESR